MQRRATLGLVAAFAAARTARAQQRPIRLVVAFPAGGPTDVVARLLGERMARELGQPVLVDNRGGANGNLAAELVAKAEPDGLTLLYNTSSIAISRALYRTLPYDLLRDLAPVALTAAAPLALAVHPAVPPRDPGSFIAWARQNSGNISYSSAGIGNISHLLSFLVMRHIGAEAVHIPYRGTAAALTDAAAGTVQFVSDALFTALPLIQDGRLRAIAVSSAERSALLPAVPSMAESGMMPAGYDIGIWQGVLAPARTPPAAIARLNAAINVALNDPEFAARLAAQGARPTGGPPARYAEHLATEVARWTRVVAESGATAE